MSIEHGERPPQLLLIDNFMSAEEVISARNILGDRYLWHRAEHESSDTERRHFTMDGNKNPDVCALDLMIKKRMHAAIERFFGDLFFIPAVCSYSKWLPGDGLGNHNDSGYSDGELWIELHNEGHPRRPLSLHLNDVSGVTYFSDGFEGGKLFFRHFDYSLEPSPGTTVMFPSTTLYEHGVTELISGERMTMTSFWPRVKTIVTSVIAKYHQDWHQLVHNPEQFYHLVPKNLIDEIPDHLLPKPILRYLWEGQLWETPRPDESGAHISVPHI